MGDKPPALRQARHHNSMIDEAEPPYTSILHLLSRHKPPFAYLDDRNCKIGAGAGGGARGKSARVATRFGLMISR
ncbi:hypothetical protein ABZ403_28945 [Micromonospora zamorensis]|uniref:hypothetical protein n=1 Tax=Micromonospora zamorensis TaxID=709883 RepID=UPI0033F3D57C